MSAEFTSLVSKIENYYADRDYTVEDAEHLSRLAILEYATQKNSLVASARQVSEASINSVIEVAVNKNIAAEPNQWMVFAANAVDNVLNYSHEGVIASGVGEYTDFLPVGHPSRTNRGAMTASALSHATALWISGDPRIASTQARLNVYDAYATKPGSIEAEYANAKLSALIAAGYIPGDVVLPITAAFNMSFAMRSAMSKILAAVRRRHRDGKFAEEFGRLRGFFSRKNGSIFSEDARIVGAQKGTNNFQVEVKNSPEIPDGIYTIDAAKTASVKALLSRRALSKVKGLKPSQSIENPSQADRDSAIPIDEFLATRADAPQGWTRASDGRFTSESGQTVSNVDTMPEGDFMVEGAGESGAVDPNEPLLQVSDKDGKTLGVAQDWAGANKISMTYDALNGEDETATDDPGFDQKAGESKSWSDEAIDFDHISDPQNWSDFDGGSSEYTSPDGRLKLNWEADGDVGDDGGMIDASGVSAEYDGQPIGSFRATERDVESGDIADGLAKLFKQESWFNPDNLMKTEDFGNSYVFSTDEGYVEVKKEYNPTTKKTGFVVSKYAKDLIDENREASYSRDDRFGSFEEAIASAEDFAKTLNDPDKLSDLLNESYLDDPGFDQNVKAPTDILPKDKEGDYRRPNRSYGGAWDETGYIFENGKWRKATKEEDAARGVTQSKGYNPFQKEDRVLFEPGLNQDAKPLSEKQMEPATDKQYALLEELNSERDGIDANTQKAVNDALENKNLSKAQMASLFGELQKKPFKPGIDPTKPTDRQINSLQGYLTTKELSPEEMDDILSKLESGLDRAGMEALTAKLRRRPDRAQDEGFNQAAQDAPGRVAYGNGFYSPDGDNSWSRTDENGNQETVEQGANGKWFATVYRYDNRDNAWNEVNQEGPFDNIQGALDEFGTEFDEELAKEWDELNSDQGFNQAVSNKSSFDTEYDNAHSEIESEIDSALNDYENNLADNGDSPEEIAQKMEKAEEAAQKLRDASYYADSIDVSRALSGDNVEGIFDSIAQKIDKNIDDLDNRQDQRDLAEQQEKADEVQSAIDNADKDTLDDMLQDSAYGSYRDEIENALAEIAGQGSGDEEDGFDQNINPTPQTSWEDLDEDQKAELTDKANDFIRRWSEESPRDFMLNWFDFAKDDEANPDGRRAIEKPYQYGETYLQYLDLKDPDMYDWLVGKLNSGDTEGFDQNVPTKTLSPKMMEPATDAQYNYLKNLAESKNGVDPETAKGIQEALDNKNLTKAQAGAFIGKLRDLADKENAGQNGKPSQKMIDSVKRDVYAKGLSDEDREEILKDLDTLSKQDVSSLISMLKELDNAPGGLEKYVASLRDKGDVEALQRLRDDGRFADVNVDIDEALKALDTGGNSEQGFDQAVKSKPNLGLNKDEYANLADELQADEDMNYAFLDREYVEGLDLDNPEDAYSLYAEMMDAYKVFRPKTEDGKALEERLKKATDDLLNKIEAGLGPIEAAKRNPEDMGSSYNFDKAIDALIDFFDYYYPSSSSSDMRNDSDGGSVGDVRGGGWEASVRFNKETGKWEADMTSPGQASESYSEEFDNQDDAADWVDNELSTQNSRAMDRDTKILAESGIDGLIAEYGDDPDKLASIIDGIATWLSWTNRGMVEESYRELGDYADRLREISSKNPKA